MQSNSWAKHLAGNSRHLPTLPCSLVPAALTAAQAASHTVNSKIVFFVKCVDSKTSLKFVRACKELSDHRWANPVLTKDNRHQLWFGDFLGGWGMLQEMQHKHSLLSSYYCLGQQLKKIPAALLNANWNNLIKMRGNYARVRHFWIGDRAPSHSACSCAQHLTLSSSWGNHLAQKLISQILCGLQILLQWQLANIIRSTGICRSHLSSPSPLPQRGHNTSPVWLLSSLHSRCCRQSISNLVTSHTDHKQLYAETEGFKLRTVTPNDRKC